MTQLMCPQGSFKLSRYPLLKKQTLRAWDAADEYLLDYLSENISNTPRTLIINDNFGALSIGLYAYSPSVQTDSFLSQQGLLHNLTENSLAESNIKLLNSMDALDGLYELVVIKVPKSHAYLEDILCKIQPHINAQTKIISAAMAKNIHTSTLKIYENIIGETSTSLAKKKARLIFSRFSNEQVSKTPSQQCFELETGKTPLTICNHANVFSREKLDMGTRFLLENLPHSEKYKTIVDLGCGNGILGLVAAQYQADANIIFCDESYMAIASAKQNFENAFTAKNNAEFYVTDCLKDVKKDSVDLILCNPPFHQNNVISDHIAWQMFNDAYAKLKQDGEFWIVGNHHLAYHAKLKTIFGGYTVTASNKKFAIMFSRKSIPKSDDR